MKANRVKGTMLGLAIGDAMGMATEFLTIDEIKEKYGKVISYQKPQLGFPTSSLKPGQYTDDTQMAIAQLQAILEKGYFCPFTTAVYFQRWGNSDNCRTPGKACLEATKALEKGTMWWMSGYPSAGCGAAMRVAPLALYHMDSKPYELINDTVSASIITHNDPRAVIGAVIVALSIYYCLKVDSINPEQLINFVYSQIKNMDKSFNKVLPKILDALSLNEESAFGYLGNGGYVIETISAALYSFLKSPNNFKETIITAVNGGNDADSVAAIAGAISGAYNGYYQLPEEWLLGLENSYSIKEQSLRLYHLINKKGRA